VFLQTRLEDSPSGKACSTDAVIGLVAKVIRAAFELVHALLDAHTFQLWRSVEGHGVVPGSARITWRVCPHPAR
jgi:hypothetical protein